jgi:zinc protease
VKAAALAMMAVTIGPAAAMEVVALPAKSPMVNFNVVFRAGAALDPAGKEGLAALTAQMLGRGGTREMTYRQLVDAMFPMAARVDFQVDKEMTSFRASTHIDNLDRFYDLFRAMLLEPGWREDDLKRNRDMQINFLRVTLRGNNDEELGKEVLYNAIYDGHPYGHHSSGKVSALQTLTLDDLKGFYRANYTLSNVILGLAGGYPPEFLDRVRKDFAKLPEGRRAPPKLPAPKKIEGLNVTIVDKETRSVAVSFGFPIAVTRGDPDFLPLLVMQSYFGQHRNSGGRLFQRIREIRGLNYGDYVYIEYFPNGMFQFQPDPNLARRQQVFQVWIRPLETPTAHFGLRLALFELDRLLKTGLTTEEFERTRLFLSKNVNLLTASKPAELGYAIDSKWYGIGEFNGYVKQGLARLTVDAVNRAIRKHLRTSNMYIVLIAKDGEEWKNKLLAGEPSPMIYNAPKPDDLLEEDKIVEKWLIPLKPENVRVVPVAGVFE